MKSLLRSSILALIVFAGIAAFSTESNGLLSNAGPRTPTGGGNVPCVATGLCAK